MRFSFIATAGLAAMQASASVVPITQDDVRPNQLNYRAVDAPVVPKVPTVPDRPDSPPDQPETGSNPPETAPEQAEQPGVPRVQDATPKDPPEAPEGVAAPKDHEASAFPEGQDTSVTGSETSKSPADAIIEMLVGEKKQCTKGARKRELGKRSPPTYAQGQDVWTQFIIHWEKLISAKPLTRAIPGYIYGGITTALNGGFQTDLVHDTLKATRKTGDIDMLFDASATPQEIQLARDTFAQTSKYFADMGYKNLYLDSSFNDHYTAQQKQAIAFSSTRDPNNKHPTQGWLTLHHVDADKQIVLKLLKLHQYATYNDPSTGQPLGIQKRDLDDLVYFLNKANINGEKITVPRLLQAATDLGYANTIGNAVKLVGKVVQNYASQNSHIAPNAGFGDDVKLVFQGSPDSMRISPDIIDGNVLPRNHDGTPSPNRVNLGTPMQIDNPGNNPFFPC